jgi:tRNA (guanine-N7-)-methyltransferase
LFIHKKYEKSKFNYQQFLTAPFYRMVQGQCMKDDHSMSLQDGNDLNTILQQVENIPDCEIRISQWEHQFDWKAIFGTAVPVEIEIGCGRGMFIINSARENPAVNYLGIEKSASFFRILRERVIKSSLENIRLIKGEAGYLLKKFVPENSVSAIHIYFPDPWPKKKHRKRRLINNGFLASVASALKKHGSLFIATDFQDYFEEIVAAARACVAIEELSCRDLSAETRDPNAALTAYERKYLTQGRTIYTALYRKK